MNVKKVIAREWLYVLIFAAGCIMLSMAVRWIFSPPEPMSSWNVPSYHDVYDFVDLSRSSQDQYFEMIDLFVTASEKDSIRAICGKYDSTWTDSAKEAYYNQVLGSFRELAIRKSGYHEITSRWHLAQNISEAIVIIPYPLFWLIRSILWAYRQVKKKPAQ